MIQVLVQTPAAELTAATFITGDESRESVSNALAILKSYNNNWTPRQWIVDSVPSRLAALQASFPGTASSPPHSGIGTGDLVYIL